MQQQQQQQQIEAPYNLFNPRHQQQEQTRMNQLERDIGQVQEVFEDIAVLVTEQGEQIDNIETNIERSDTTVENAIKELRTAYKYKQRKRKCYRKCACFTAITTTVTVLLWIVTYHQN